MTRPIEAVILILSFLCASCETEQPKTSEHNNTSAQPQESPRGGQEPADNQPSQKVRIGPQYSGLLPDDFKYLKLGMPTRVFNNEYYPNGPFRRLSSPKQLRGPFVDPLYKSDPNSTWYGASINNHRWFDQIYLQFTPSEGLYSIELTYHNESGNLDDEISSFLKKQGLVNYYSEGSEKQFVEPNPPPPPSDKPWAKYEWAIHINYHNVHDIRITLARY